MKKLCLLVLAAITLSANVNALSLSEAKRIFDEGKAPSLEQIMDTSWDGVFQTKENKNSHNFESKNLKDSENKIAFPVTESFDGKKIMSVHYTRVTDENGYGALSTYSYDLRTFSDAIGFDYGFSDKPKELNFLQGCRIVDNGKVDKLICRIYCYDHRLVLGYRGYVKAN